MKEEPPNRSKMQGIYLKIISVMFGVANEYRKEENVVIKNAFHSYTIFPIFKET